MDFEHQNFRLRPFSLPNRRLLLLPKHPPFLRICHQSLPLYILLANRLRSGAISISMRFIRRRVERFCLNGFYFPFDSEVYDLMPFFFPIDRVICLQSFQSIALFVYDRWTASNFELLPNNLVFLPTQFCTFFLTASLTRHGPILSSFKLST